MYKYFMHWNNIYLIRVLSQTTSVPRLIPNSLMVWLLEYQIRHNTLLSQLQDAELRHGQFADNRKSLDILCNKFDDWMLSAKETVGNSVELDTDLNQMKEHIVQLHVSPV